MFAWPRASAIAEQAAGHPAAEAPAWPRATDAERRVATSDRRRSRGRVRTATGWPGLLIGLGFLVAAALADVLAPADPLVPVGPPLAPPSAAYRMGTDDLGRDLLSGLVYGVRTTVPAALLVGLFLPPLGVGGGAAAGARGGRLDDLLMRLSEFWQVLPRFFLAMMVIALFGPGLDRIVLVLALTSWVLLPRVAGASRLLRPPHPPGHPGGGEPRIPRARRPECDQSRLPRQPGAGFPAGSLVAVVLPGRGADPRGDRFVPSRCRA